MPKEPLDTFSLGKDLAKYVPGFKVEAIELPGKSLAFATTVGEIDDKKKKILIKLWPGATRQDALAILAHEYSHLQKGTTIIEKGLTEQKVWGRGAILASQWGVSEEYLKLATDLVEYYERTGSYPRITAGIKNWLSSESGVRFAIEQLKAGKTVDEIFPMLTKILTVKQAKKALEQARKEVYYPRSKELVEAVRKEVKAPADYDRLYTLKDLQEMCREKGLPASGDKKALIRRLFFIE